MLHRGEWLQFLSVGPCPLCGRPLTQVLRCVETDGGTERTPVQILCPTPTCTPASTPDPAPTSA